MRDNAPNYEAMWYALKEWLLKMQQGEYVRCATEKDVENIWRAQGTCGMAGSVFNQMGEMERLAQGQPETEG